MGFHFPLKPERGLRSFSGISMVRGRRRQAAVLGLASFPPLTCDSTGGKRPADLALSQGSLGVGLWSGLSLG